MAASRATNLASDSLFSQEVKGCFCASPVLADTERETPRVVSWKDVPMPVRYPDEFRQRAIELARAGDKPVTRIAADLGIAPSCLRRWMKQDDIDGGRQAGLDTDERAELVRLRRELRTAQMEVEILRRAAAYFAKGTLPGPK
jgi:transposase